MLPRAVGGDRDRRHPRDDQAGLYNVDQFRAGIDDLEPLSYLSVGYYGRWLHTLEVNCVQAGVFTEEELEARLAAIAEQPDAPLPRGDRPARSPTSCASLVENGASNARTVPEPPAFAVGDRVRGRRLPDARHVRIPGYAQGREGTVHLVHEAFVFPDTNLRDEGENPAVRLRRRASAPATSGPTATRTQPCSSTSGRATSSRRRGPTGAKEPA